MLCPGATPRSGWAVDPFGHSSTMPYLLRRANLTSMLIQRVHYAIKKHFAATHSLEFMWRQMWGKAREGYGSYSSVVFTGEGAVHSNQPLCESCLPLLASGGTSPAGAVDLGAPCPVPNLHILTVLSLARASVSQGCLWTTRIYTRVMSL